MHALHQSFETFQETYVNSSEHEKNNEHPQFVEWLKKFFFGDLKDIWSIFSKNRESMEYYYKMIFLNALLTITEHLIEIWPSWISSTVIILSSCMEMRLKAIFQNNVIAVCLLIHCKQICKSSTSNHIRNKGDMPGNETLYNFQISIEPFQKEKVENHEFFVRFPLYIMLRKEIWMDFIDNLKVGTLT